MGNGFTINAHRFDPYKNFKFRVLWTIGGTPTAVLGVSKVGALKRTTEVVPHRDGADPSHDRNSPGKSKYEAVSMERGITHDPEFENWANKIHPFGGDAGMDLVGYKKDLILEVMNERGQVVFRYFLYNCWVSEFTALPELNASENAIAIESLTLQIEGWERDVATTEPDESADVPQVG